MATLQKCITADGLVMAAVLDSTDIVREAARIHKCTPLAAAALGRLLTGASIMGNKLKELNASLTLRINGGGPLGSLIAVSDCHGNVKGYVQDTGVSLDSKGYGQPDVAAAVGSEGYLTVIKDYGSGEPYAAQCPLVSGKIAEDLTGYYATSEQVPTVFALGVHFDEGNHVSKAGGLLIQLLPAADDREIVKLEKSLASLPPISTMLDEVTSLREILAVALDGFSIEYFDPETVSYRCDCNIERVTRALLTLRPEELSDMADKDGQAHVECHFCDRTYDLTREQLLELAKAASEK